MINNGFKYALDKSSRKFICPKCGKKRAVRYVDLLTKEYIPEQYARCDRETDCGYHLNPYEDGFHKGDESKYKFEPVFEPIAKPDPDFIPFDVVEKTFNNFKKNPFFLYLVKLFGIDKAFELQEMYHIGTAKNYGTTFAQIDREGKCRTIKVFYYNEFGRRRKDKPSWFLHARSHPKQWDKWGYWCVENGIKKNFELVQVFFGEHLINPENPVYLVESEKSAIIMAGFYPEFTWIASGGSNMLNVERLTRLTRLDKVFPDHGQFDLWQEKTKHIAGAKMDGRVEIAFKKGIIKKGDDVLDLELIERGLEKVSITN